MGRGQVSVEYLVIAGIAIGLLIPAILFLHRYSEAARSTSVSEQINGIGLEMVSTAKSTFGGGRNARQTLVATLPEEVGRVHVQNGQELVVEYMTVRGPSNAVFFSQINLTGPSGGNISTGGGLKTYRFESLGQQVRIEAVG